MVGVEGCVFFDRNRVGGRDVQRVRNWRGRIEHLVPVATLDSIFEPEKRGLIFEKLHNFEINNFDKVVSYRKRKPVSSF